MSGSENIALRWRGRWGDSIPDNNQPTHKSEHVQREDAMADPAFTEEAAQQINAIDGMNAELTAVEQARDTAQATVRSLKRKYEPDGGVIMDKMLQLNNDYHEVYMRVLVRAGEYLLLEIVRTVRHNGPAMHFRPPVQGKRDNMQDFGSYGVYEVYIGDGTIGHCCLLRFSENGVSMTPTYNSDGPLVIKEFTQPAAVDLTIE
jgi:hypothetical protein